MYLPTMSDGLKSRPMKCRLVSRPLPKALMPSNVMIGNSCNTKVRRSAARLSKSGRRRRARLLQRKRRSLRFCVGIEGQHVLLDVERRHVVDILVFELVESSGVDPDVLDAREIRQR